MCVCMIERLSIRPLVPSLSYVKITHAVIYMYNVPLVQNFYLAGYKSRTMAWQAGSIVLCVATGSGCMVEEIHKPCSDSARVCMGISSYPGAAQVELWTGYFNETTPRRLGWDKRRTIPAAGSSVWVRYVTVFVALLLHTVLEPL